MGRNKALCHPECDVVANGKCKKCYSKEYRQTHPKETERDRDRWRRAHPKGELLQGARRRAKLVNVPFTITEEDFEIPKLCPVLGIPLIRRSGKPGPSANSPTLDRVIPELGYVPGNVVVISGRANRLKGDGTAVEHARLAAWIMDNDKAE